MTIEPVTKCPVRRDAKGFTLVELLVVIGIIALLVSILLPTLSAARQSANSVKCLSSLRQHMTGILFYAEDNLGSLPPGEASTPRGDGTFAFMPWGLSIMKYFGTGDGTGDTPVSANEGIRDVFLCPDAIDSGGSNVRNHYSSHPLLMPNNNNVYPVGHPYRAPGKSRTPYRLAQIDSSAEKIVIMDGTQDMTGTNPGASNLVAFNLDFNRIAGTSTGATEPGMTYPATYLIMDFVPGAEMGVPIDGGVNEDFTGPPNAERRNANIRWRHKSDSAANVSFVDGHAEARRYKSRGENEILRKNVHINYIQP